MRSAAIAVDPLAHGLPCSHICGAATMICCLRRSTLRLTRRYILLAARNTDTARPMHVCCLRSAPPHICSDAASVHSRHSGNSRARAMRWIHSADLPSSDRERRNALLAVIPRSARSTRARAHARRRARAPLPTRPTPRRVGLPPGAIAAAEAHARKSRVHIRALGCHPASRFPRRQRLEGGSMLLDFLHAIAQRSSGQSHRSRPAKILDRRPGFSLSSAAVCQGLKKSTEDKGVLG